MPAKSEKCWSQRVVLFAPFSMAWAINSPHRQYVLVLCLGKVCADFFMFRQAVFLSEIDLMKISDKIREKLSSQLRETK